VARDGIEPPTHGFSVGWPICPASITSAQRQLKFPVSFWSLNFSPRCLKVIDTFRLASLSLRGDYFLASVSKTWQASATGLGSGSLSKTRCQNGRSANRMKLKTGVIFLFPVLTSNAFADQYSTFRVTRFYFASLAISLKFAKTNVQPFIAMLALPAAFGSDNIQIDRVLAATRRRR